MAETLQVCGPLDNLTPAPKVSDQFGITRRTLSRWLLDEALAFPRPVEINNRLYFRQTEIESWKTLRAVRNVKEAA